MKDGGKKTLGTRVFSVSSDKVQISHNIILKFSVSLDSSIILNCYKQFTKMWKQSKVHQDITRLKGLIEPKISSKKTQESKFNKQVWN